MLIIPKEIQEMMLADAVKYNIRLSFPNKERTDITCNQIVEGSAKFTESLCSQDSLKFGLCESPVFECETVGVGNINGKEIDIVCHRRRVQNGYTKVCFSYTYGKIYCDILRTSSRYAT